MACSNRKRLSTMRLPSRRMLRRHNLSPRDLDIGVEVWRPTVVNDDTEEASGRGAYTSIGMHSSYRRRHVSLKKLRNPSKTTLIHFKSICQDLSV